MQIKNWSISDFIFKLFFRWSFDVLLPSPFYSEILLIENTILFILFEHFKQLISSSFPPPEMLITVHGCSKLTFLQLKVIFLLVISNYEYGLDFKILNSSKCRLRHTTMHSLLKIKIRWGFQNFRYFSYSTSKFRMSIKCDLCNYFSKFM